MFTLLHQNFAETHFDSFGSLVYVYEHPTSLHVDECLLCLTKVFGSVRLWGHLSSTWPSSGHLTEASLLFRWSSFVDLGVCLDSLWSFFNFNFLTTEEGQNWVVFGTVYNFSHSSILYVSVAMFYGWVWSNCGLNVKHFGAVTSYLLKLGAHQLQFLANRRLPIFKEP